MHEKGFKCFCHDLPDPHGILNYWYKSSNQLCVLKIYGYEETKGRIHYFVLKNAFKIKNQEQNLTLGHIDMAFKWQYACF